MLQNSSGTNIQVDDFPNEVDLINLNRNSDMKIMGWKPPQRPEWVKEVMKTPGHTRVQLLLLLILATSSVTSTALLISKQAKSTSDVNTLPVVESLEVGNEKLRVRVTGNATMEVLRNLKTTLQSMDETFSSVK